MLSVYYNDFKTYTKERDITETEIFPNNTQNKYDYI